MNTGLYRLHHLFARRVLGLAATAVLLATPAVCQPPAGMITFNNDGGWCWFQDERAIIHDGKLIIASVAGGRQDPARRGNIEVVTCELATGNKHLSVLHRNLQFDDHACPALLVRPDGRILALYSKHGPENHFYYRISREPNDPTRWGPEKTFTPSQTSRITYSNLHFLAKEDGRGRVYDFYRGLDASFKPSYAYSDDYGETWTSGNVIIQVPAKFRHRPYVKYASNGLDTVHFFYTDGHPRDYDNSVYHIYYRQGRLYRSDGTLIRSLREGLKKPAEGTRVFAGDPNNVAWVCDLALDEQGRPVGVYSVQKDSAGLPRGQGGEDIRYGYARWTGTRWVKHEMAHAGSRLYAGEDDYSGLAALDPDDLSTVYISTNAQPVTGEPLISKTDGKRHYEIFKGVTADGGASWKWTAITRNSTVDNLRPIVPKWDRDHTALLWLRGVYHAYTNYSLEVVGLITGRE